MSQQIIQNQNVNKDEPPFYNIYRYLIYPKSIVGIETSCEGRHPPIPSKTGWGIN